MTKMKAKQQMRLKSEKLPKVTGFMTVFYIPFLMIWYMYLRKESLGVSVEDFNSCHFIYSSITCLM